MKPWLTDKRKEEIKSLHADGLTNRAIADRVSCHHGTVGYWLKKFGLKPNGPHRQPLMILPNGTAECSKCKKMFALNEFLFNRRGQKYEYRFTYCLACRRKQLSDNLNSSTDKFLGNVWCRLRLRAKKNNIKFSISRDVFLEQFNKQKGLCFYTDAPLRCKSGNGKDFLASLSVDKIVPSIGYANDNFVFCTNRVNTAKSNFSLGEVKTFMPGWYKRLVESGKIK